MNQNEQTQKDWVAKPVAKVWKSHSYCAVGEDRVAREYSFSCSIQALGKMPPPGTLLYAHPPAKVLIQLMLAAKAVLNEIEGCGAGTEKQLRDALAAAKEVGL